MPGIFLVLSYEKTYEKTGIILVGWGDLDEKEKECKSTEEEFCKSSAFLLCGSLELLGALHKVSLSDHTAAVFSNTSLSVLVCWGREPVYDNYEVTEAFTFLIQIRALGLKLSCCLCVQG